MTGTKAYESEAISVNATTSALEISDIMDAESVGCVVVVDADDRPMGIVTDRDLMRRVIAAGRDPEKCNAEDVMTADLLTGDRDEMLQSLIDRMRQHRIRRLPILRKGHVVALLSLDDVVMELAAQLSGVANGIRVELRESNRGARKRRRHEAREEAFEEVRSELTKLGHDVKDRVRDEISDVLDRLRGGSS